MSREDRDKEFRIHMDEINPVNQAPKGEHRGSWRDQQPEPVPTNPVHMLDKEIESLQRRLQKFLELRELVQSQPGIMILEKYLELKRDLGLR